MNLALFLEVPFEFFFYFLPDFKDNLTKTLMYYLSLMTMMVRPLSYQTQTRARNFMRKPTWQLPSLDYVKKKKK